MGKRGPLGREREQFITRYNLKADDVELIKSLIQVILLLHWHHGDLHACVNSKAQALHEIPHLTLRRKQVVEGYGGRVLATLESEDDD